jgi:hypothetical protein
MLGVATAAAALLAACAHGPVREDGFWRDRSQGWTVAEPGPPGYWKRVRVDDAALAWAGAQGEHLALSVRCGVALARPEVLARHLRFGLGPSVLHESRAVAVGGRDGWLQAFDAAGPDRGRVHVRAVTRVDAHCIEDLVLTSSASDRVQADAGFDAWWQSFRSTPGSPTACRDLARRPS